MKSLIKYFLFLILIFYSYSPVFSQQYYNHTSMPSYKIEQTTYSYGGSANYSSSSYSYGYSEHYWSNANPPYTEYKEVVTFYEFNFNFLPSDAYNIVVKIESYRSSGSGTSKFVKTVDNVSSNDDARFNAVNNGSELFTVDNSSGTWHNITSSVSSNIASRGKVNFGVRRANIQYGYVTTYILVTWDAPSHITAKNNFSGGSIKVGINTSPSTKNSPYNFSANVGSTINLMAIEQNNGDYYMLWNDTEASMNKSKWVKEIGQNYSFKSNNISYSFTTATDDDDASYVANLRKLCNITFKNQHTSGEEGGTIKVNGTTYNSPTSTFNVVEQNQITASAIDHKINEIDFKFEKWSDNSTQQTNHSFYPSSTTQYKAIFEGTPKFGQAIRNLHFNSYNPRVQQYVKLYWNEHPSSNVTQYKIWRKGKEKNGSTIPEQLIATVNRGTTSYTDYDYYLTSGYSDALLQYDVQAYYQPDNTVSNQEYITVYGEGSGVEKTAAQDTTESLAAIYEYGISNYPNPYNPATTINYQIKETGNVSIVVYDALGRKVKELVNEVKQPGSYNVTFNGASLSSGIYFYTMRVNDFTASKKMLLTK